MHEKVSLKQIAAFICALILLGLMVIGITACADRKTDQDAPLITETQVYHDLQYIAAESHHTPDQDLYARALDALDADDNDLSIEFDENYVIGEVRLTVTNTALGDVQVCLLYDKDNDSEAGYSLYDYGYVALD